MSLEYFIDFYNKNKRYPTFEEWRKLVNISPKFKDKTDEELKAAYKKKMEKSITVFVEANKRAAIKSLKDVLTFLLNVRARNLRRTPGFNYRNLPDAERARFKTYVDDMMKTTIEATETGDAKKLYKLSPNLPKTIKLPGANSYMLGDVVHAVRSTLIRKTIGDVAAERVEEIEKIKNNPDISDSNKEVMIDTITDDIIQERIDSMMRMDDEDRIEILHQQMEGNTTTSISEPENSPNYSSVVGEEIKENVFNDPEYASLLGLSISLPVKEIIDRLPTHFKPYESPNEKPFEIKPNILTIPDPLPDIPPVFWTNNKIAVVGALTALLAAGGLKYYLSQKSENEKSENEKSENENLLISNEEFEKKKKEGFIPLEASKKEFLEAYNLTTPESFEKIEKGEGFGGFLESVFGSSFLTEKIKSLKAPNPYDYNEASNWLKNYQDPIFALIESFDPSNFFREPVIYTIPKPFIEPYTTPGFLAPSQKVPGILEEINNIPTPITPVLEPTIPIINNNYTQKNLHNIMSFQTPYKTYEDLPEYMKVFITREEFNAAMAQKGTINDLILKKKGYNDGRNNLLSNLLPRVPSEKIPIRREGKFLSAFPTSHPNATPKSFPRDEVQNMIGTDTHLRKDYGNKRWKNVEYSKEREHDNTELLGSETRLIKKVKKIPLY